ncbi:MAG: hypothetical protein AAGI52_08355 [Bacteroidota bacterium]
MSRVLFLIHGMGVHGTDWAQEVTDKLGEVATRYDRFPSLEALQEAVEFVPITYDHVFKGQLQRWADAADNLREFTRENEIDLGRGAVLFDWIAGASKEEENFFWSHTIDVILYHYVREVQSQVRLHVMHQIADALAARETNGRRVESSVLAHSLGTAVAHDSLHILGTVPLDGNESFLTPGNQLFESFITLANVSRVLQTVANPHESIVVPRSASRPRGYVRRYYNFRHALDPIPAFWPFGPSGWAPKLVSDLGLDFLRDVNVHGFAHYLDGPRVHIPILNEVVPGAIPDDEAAAAIAGYPTVGGSACADGVAELVESARKILATIGSSKDPKRLVTAGAEFLAAAESAADAC